MRSSLPRPIPRYQQKVTHQKVCKVRQAPKVRKANPDLADLAERSAQQVNPGSPVHQEREEQMDQQHKGLLGLLALSGLAVVQGVLAQRGVAAYQEALDPQDHKALPVSQYRESLELQGRLAHPAYLGPRAIRDR